MKTAKRQGQGFTLVEVLLTVGAVSVLSAAIYLALAPTSATAQVKVEQDNLNSLSTAIDRSFGLLGTFAGDPVSGAGGATTAQIISDGLAPRRMVSGASLLTGWGTSATIMPAAVARPGDAFVITYPATPADVCAKLAAAVSSSVYDLKVGGSSVMTAGGLDPATTAERCSKAGGATMAFVYHSGLVAGTVVAASPLTLPPAPPGATPPPAAPIATPAGPALPVAPVLPAAPVAPAGGSPALPTAPPFGPLPPAPAPAPVPAPVPTPAPAPSGAPPACQESSTTATQSPACPAGQSGTWTQQRTVSTLCRDVENKYQAWNSPTTTTGPWVDVVNTCAPACVAPASTTASQSPACPAGQSGTWTQQQTTTWSCPAPTGAAVSTTGPWVDTVNTCAPSSAPSNWQCRDATTNEATGSTWTAHGPNGVCGDTTSGCLGMNSPQGNSIWLHRYNANKGFDQWICGCVGDTAGSSATFMGRFPGNGVPAGQTSAYWTCP